MAIRRFFPRGYVEEILSLPSTRLGWEIAMSSGKKKGDGVGEDWGIVVMWSYIHPFPSFFFYFETCQPLPVLRRPREPCSLKLPVDKQGCQLKPVALFWCGNLQPVIFCCLRSTEHSQAGIHSLAGLSLGKLVADCQNKALDLLIVLPHWSGKPRNKMVLWH